MQTTGPERQPGPDAQRPHLHQKPRVYTLEATGLIIIGIVVLLLTIIRYWHYIPWSVR